MAEKDASGLPSDADFETPSPMTYRVAVGPSGEHGYEIGYWKANADPLNPNDFIVVEGCYDQQEAAARAAVLNLEHMQTGPKAKSSASPQKAKADDDDDDDDDAPHKRAAKHRR